MKLFRILALALLCLALCMTLLACGPDDADGEADGTETEETKSFIEEIFDNIFGGGDETTDGNGNEDEPADEPSNEIDHYPEYGVEIPY